MTATTETGTPVRHTIRVVVACAAVVAVALLASIGVVLAAGHGGHEPAKVDIGTAVTEYPPTATDACRWLKREADAGVPAADRWGHYVAGTGNYYGADSMLATVLTTCPEALQ